MIIAGVVLGLAFFLFVGWIISTEMFQQRSWRRRVASGDHEIVEALVLEAMASWSRARPARDTPASLWAGVQRAELAAANAELAVVQSSAEGEFRTVEGRREQVSSALEEAFALAARLVGMMLYDVPNLSLGSVRVDVYSTFTADGGAAFAETDPDDHRPPRRRRMASIGTISPRPRSSRASRPPGNPPPAVSRLPSPCPPSRALPRTGRSPDGTVPLPHLR